MRVHLPHPGFRAAVHPALLQHPDPRRVLLLGGGVAGHVSEAVKQIRSA